MFWGAEHPGSVQTVCPSKVLFEALAFQVALPEGEPVSGLVSPKSRTGAAGMPNQKWIGVYLKNIGACYSFGTEVLVFPLWVV